ncbi:MAG: NifU family protein [Spirochaetes bacterium]|nr:NifU family protein [Spirochaetota bacterium]
MLKKLELPIYIEQVLRPMVNVDGGDIRLAKVEDNTIFLIAGAECAHCQGCGPDLSLWLQAEINKYYQSNYQVNLVVEKPYYYQ